MQRCSVHNQASSWKIRFDLLWENVGWGRGRPLQCKTVSSTTTTHWFAVPMADTMSADVVSSLPMPGSDTLAVLDPLLATPGLSTSQLPSVDISALFDGDIGSANLITPSAAAVVDSYGLLRTVGSSSGSSSSSSSELLHHCVSRSVAYTLIGSLGVLLAIACLLLILREVRWRRYARRNRLPIVAPRPGASADPKYIEMDEPSYTGLDDDDDDDNTPSSDEGVTPPSTPGRQTAPVVGTFVPTVQPSRVAAAAPSSAFVINMEDEDRIPLTVGEKDD